MLNACQLVIESRASRPVQQCFNLCKINWALPNTGIN